MSSPTRRGRVLDLCLVLLMLEGTACGAGAPAAPVSIPAPVAARSEVPVVRRQKVKPRPQPKAEPAPERTLPERISPARKSPVRKLPAAPLDSAALERAVTKEYAHLPLAIALARRSGNPEVAEQAAAALVREAERLRLSPSLLGAVLLIENTPLDPAAVSSQGAIGLMQVMPIHRGSYGCFADLVNVETNICHGASILKHMVRRTNSVSLALRKYNGCVRGRNTPRCHRYPVRVLRTASRLRREILLTAADSRMNLQETLAASPRRTSAGYRHLVSSPDSVDSETESSPISCASFFGCLRTRWTMKY